MTIPRQKRNAANRGFTLLEVMVAILLGMIALVGTMAVQQSLLLANKNVKDGSVATRLAIQKVEELLSRTLTGNVAPNRDEISGLPNPPLNGPPGIVTCAPTPPPACLCTAGCAWTAGEYLDAEGKRCTDGAACPDGGSPTMSNVATYRWLRSWRIENPGANLPYRIAVRVQYKLDSGSAKEARLDVERVKTW